MGNYINRQPDLDILYINVKHDSSGNMIKRTTEFNNDSFMFEGCDINRIVLLYQVHWDTGSKKVNVLLTIRH